MQSIQNNQLQSASNVSQISNADLSKEIATESSNLVKASNDSLSFSAAFDDAVITDDMLQSPDDTNTKDSTSEYSDSIQTFIDDADDGLIEGSSFDFDGDGDISVKEEKLAMNILAAMDAGKISGSSASESSSSQPTTTVNTQNTGSVKSSVSVSSAVNTSVSKNLDFGGLDLGGLDITASSVIPKDLTPDTSSVASATPMVKTPMQTVAIPAKTNL